MFFDSQKNKKIVVLLGHPNSGQTYCGELALLYETAAKKAGHEVRRFNLGDIQFDPILHKGYMTRQELEPQLKELQDAISWCDHFVVIYPTWWCSLPALLKGMFDRMWLPGFAFNFYKTGIGAHLDLHKKLLVGKTARVITLSAGQPTLLKLFNTNHTRIIRKAILEFAGMKTSVSTFGPSLKAPEWKRNEWRRRVVRLGTHAL